MSQTVVIGKSLNYNSDQIEKSDLEVANLKDDTN